MSDDASRAFYAKALRHERDRYAPGTRVMLWSQPGTITRYYAIGPPMVHVALDSGEGWLVGAWRTQILTEYPWCDIYPELAGGTTA